MKRSIGKIIASLALALISLLPGSVHAIGQITEPIDIKNALREKTYSETVTMVNTESVANIIQLSADGDFAGWVRFYKDTSSTDNITDIEVAPDARASVIARFTIPAGTPNGSYHGTIAVSKKTGDYTTTTEDSGSSLSQKIDREATVEVNDVENVTFDTSIIPETYDLDQGQSLKIRVIHDNRGNIQIKPQISMKIKQGDSVIYSAIFPYPDNQPAVGPYSLFEIPALEIPTTTLENGKYEATFTISEGEKYSIDKDFTFSIGMVKVANAVASSAVHPLGVSQFTIVLVTLLVLYLILRPKIKNEIKKNRDSTKA